MIESQYILGEVLGEGKFSKVYKGYKKSKPEEVLAIKVLNLEQLVAPPPVGHGPIYKKYWNREIEVMRALIGHPNIVCLEGIENYNDKIAYIAMEFCNKDLKSFLADPHQKGKQRRLSEQEAQICMRQLANAFKFMCGLAIAHRDLKPQNVLVTTYPDGTFVLKISDFGFARKMEKETNMQASALGTPLYMAPEVHHKKYSDTCDLWSLGVIFYELMFGFQGLSNKVLEFHNGHVAKIIEPENLSKDCKNLMIGLLQPDPNKRISMLDFFSHPFIVEPHPEVSLLSTQQLSQLGETDTIQVFIFPTLENYTIAFDDTKAVWEWKKNSGLNEDDLLVLCRDTSTNENDRPERWSGIEMRDYENLDSYQLGKLGTANKCVFVFRRNATINPKDLLADLPPAPEIVPTDLPYDEFFSKCKAFVAELNTDFAKVYEICSKFVLTRALMIYALRALCNATRSKTGDVEGDIHKAQQSFGPYREKWDKLLARFTQTCSTVDQFATIALPPFLRPSPVLLTELKTQKQKELEEEKVLLNKIESAFAAARKCLSLELPKITLDEELKNLLNGEIYEGKKNVEQFKNNFEKASAIPSDKCEGEEKKAWLTLLNYSEVLTKKVRLFYAQCQAIIPQTIDLENQVSKVLAHYTQLSKLSDPTSAELCAIPNLEKAIITFSNSLQPLIDFNDLPDLVERVLRLLHERQRYELMMQKVVPNTEALLLQLFDRYNNLDGMYNKHRQQIEQIFPRFSQISSLPRPSITLNPLLSLAEYQQIPASFLFPPSPLPKKDEEIDLETEFSIILSDHTSMSGLVRENGVLAEKLRNSARELDEVRSKLVDAEARAGVGAGELARRVALYERMVTLKTQGSESLKTKLLEEEKRKIEETAQTEIEEYKKRLEAEKKTVDESKKAMQNELELHKKKMHEELDSYKKKMQAEMEELKKKIQEDSKSLTLQRKTAEEARAQALEKLHAHSCEVESLRAQVREIDTLRAQVREIEALRAQVAQESEARRGAEEVSQALTTQVALLRDTVMAYEISYAMDMPQQPQQPPPPPT